MPKRAHILSGLLQQAQAAVCRSAATVTRNDPASESAVLSILQHANVWSQHQNAPQHALPCQHTVLQSSSWFSQQSYQPISQDSHASSQQTQFIHHVADRRLTSQDALQQQEQMQGVGISNALQAAALLLPYTQHRLLRNKLQSGRDCFSMPVAVADGTLKAEQLPDDRKQEQQPADSSSKNPSTQDEAHEPAQDSKSSTSRSHQQPNDDNEHGEDQERKESDLLVEWRLATSTWYGTGLDRMMAMHLAFPVATTWGWLYSGTEAQSWGSKLVFKLGFTVLGRVWRSTFRHSKLVAVPMLQMAHEELSTDDGIIQFKSDLTSAVQTVVELYAKGDWDALKPMVSAALLDSMQSTHEAETERAEEDGKSIHDVTFDVHTLDIVCTSAINRKQLAALDSERSQAQLQTDRDVTGKDVDVMWDVVHVFVKGDWQARVRSEEGSQNVTVPRRGYFAFCRGPVQFDQKIPADADVPWFVLAWM